MSEFPFHAQSVAPHVRMWQQVIKEVVSSFRVLYLSGFFVVDIIHIISGRFGVSLSM